MDPKACLEEALEILRHSSLTKKERDRVDELLDAYFNWRMKQGFEPKLEVAGDALSVVLKRAHRHMKRYG